jgi:hypothetical protein
MTAAAKRARKARAWKAWAVMRGPGFTDPFYVTFQNPRHGMHLVPRGRVIRVRITEITPSAARRARRKK